MRARLVLREPGVDAPPPLPLLARPAMTLIASKGRLGYALTMANHGEATPGSVTAQEAACCLIFDLPSARCSQARCSS